MGCQSILRVSRFQLSTLCLLCGLVFAAEVGARSASGEEDLTAGGKLRVSVEAVNSPLLVGEPLYLRLSWYNISEQTVPLVFRGVYQVHVGAEGQPSALLRLYRGWLPSMSIRVSPVNLAPGQVHVRTLWVDLVGEGGLDVRLLFDRAGTYRLRPEGFPADSAALVEVRDPVDPQDRQASRLWNQAAARAWGSARDFAHETSTGPVRAAVDEILTKCPESCFAAYAAWIRVMDLKHGMRWGDSSDVDYPAVLKWLEFILARHPKSPLREIVLEGSVDAYSAQKDWSRAREMAEQLAREFPAPPSVGRTAQDLCRPLSAAGMAAGVHCRTAIPQRLRGLAWAAGGGLGVRGLYGRRPARASARLQGGRSMADRRRGGGDAPCRRRGGLAGFQANDLSAQDAAVGAVRLHGDHGG